MSLNEKPSQVKSDSELPRRRFLTRLFVGVSGAGALWLGMQQWGWAKIAKSFFTLDHHVDNPRSTSTFVARDLHDAQCIRFFALGDWGTGDAFQRKVASAMATTSTKEHPQFIVSTGDNFYPSGIDSTKDPQLGTKWREVYKAPSLQLPWYVALGNHDYRNNPDAEVAYSLVESRWHMPGRYFMFNQVQGSVKADFFVIDTQMLGHGSDAEIQAQLRWLETSLKSSTAPWKVVVGHHPIRSHGAYGDQKFMLTMVKPLLDRYGVHLYLNGHDHDLQYLKAAEDSFVCVISGGGGGSRNTSYGKNTRFAATNGGFVYIALTENFIHVQFLDSTGKVVYADDAVTKQ